MNNQPSSGGGYRPPEYKKFSIYPDGGKVREITAPNIVGKHLAQPSPEVEARLEARRMERKRARRNRRLLRAAAVALAFMAGFIVGFAIATASPGTPLSATANAADAGPAPATEFIRSYVAPSATTELTPPMNNAFELWSIERWQSETPLLQIDLDPATQWAIYYACDRDPAIFCAVMAIAYKESRFQPDTIGDGGRSVGMMQINTRWHKDRMEALGITDLTDPVQSALVAIDYLRELSTDYGLGWVEDESLYIGYNAGPNAAARMLRNGTTSTAYSREAIALYRAYAEEMEAAND